MSKRVRFTFEDWGWVVISLGMGTGAGIAMVPVEAGLRGFWIFILASVICYPSMYLFQRVFVNSLMGKRSADDYIDNVTGYLGTRAGRIIGAAYFLMLVIWFLVYSETVVRDAASYLYTFVGTPSGLGENPLFIIGTIGVLTQIALTGEKVLFRLSSVLAISVLVVIFALGLVMIPHWNHDNIEVLPGIFGIIEDVLITLPFVLTSILFLQSLSPMVFSFRKSSESLEVAWFRSQRAMTIAYLILFFLVFFYAVSFNLSITQSEAQQAHSENVTALAIVARGAGSRVWLTVLSVLLDVMAVLTCFLVVTLALRASSHHLIRGAMIRMGMKAPSERTVGRVTLATVVLLATVNAYANIPLIWFFLVSSPIFGIVGCFVPVYMIRKIDELQRFRGFQLWLVTFTGILLCLAPLVALIRA